MTVFAIKHPFEEVELKKVLLKVAIYLGFLSFMIMVMFFRAHYSTTAFDVFFITMFIIESLLNLSIPYFYINGKPNLKEYVSKTVSQGFHNIIDPIANFVADVINPIFNFVMFLRPSPRVYPTIE